MNLLTLSDWKPKQVIDLLGFAAKVKKQPKSYSGKLSGKTLAMLFQKTSTRTRVSFEVGMLQLGGHAIFLDWRNTNFTLGSANDEVKSLERYCDAIMARVFRHSDIEAIAAASSKPVINGLSDLWHPCQTLADLLAFKEHVGKFKGRKIAFVGDGNNVCNSLIVGCGMVGLNISVATPKEYPPLAEAVELGKSTGLLELTNDPFTAVKGADVIYTDTWVSMGQEAETAVRERVFLPYQLNRKLFDAAGGNPLIMHDLPAHRGKEITDEIIDHKNSIIFDQAENRMHAQKALLLTLLGKD